MKISQLKSNIQTIITSLNNLEKLRENHTQNHEDLSAQIARCKEQLDTAFNNLESESLDKLVNQINKRKSKRSRCKQKIKRTDSQTKNRIACQVDGSNSNPFASEKTLSKLQKCQLRSSKKYIAFIESLENLHRLKAGGDSCKLKESLNPITSIWQSTEDGIKKESNHNSLRNIWDEVLFGGKPEIEIVPDLHTFLERRFTWDTYLDSSNGSHIPVGWVCPKDDARPEWKQFLQLT